MWCIYRCIHWIRIATERLETNLQCRVWLCMHTYNAIYALCSGVCGGINGKTTAAVLLRWRIRDKLRTIHTHCLCKHRRYTTSVFVHYWCRHLLVLLRHVVVICLSLPYTVANVVEPLLSIWQQLDTNKTKQQHKLQVFCSKSKDHVVHFE